MTSIYRLQACTIPPNPSVICQFTSLSIWQILLTFLFFFIWCRIVNCQIFYSLKFGTDSEKQKQCMWLTFFFQPKLFDFSIVYPFESNMTLSQWVFLFGSQTFLLVTIFFLLYVINYLEKQFNILLSIYPIILDRFFV